MPKNRKCPSCGQTINVLRAPVFKDQNYCSSDCAIDAWQAEQRILDDFALKTKFGK